MPIITQAQIESWLGTAFWPFVRIGACLMIAPLFGTAYVPARLRIVIAGALTLIALPLIHMPAGVTLLSIDGVLITIQQLLIGAAVGFSLQLVFDALTLGGQLLANGMGLGFAFNLDPLRGVSTPALGQLYVVLGTLTFIALNGHVAMVELLVGTFRAIPVSTQGLHAGDLSALANLGSQLFAGALRIALPGIAALLVINLAFGVTSRAAPALNLFAVGLPVTLVFGLVIIILALPNMQSGFIDLMGSMFQFISGLGAAR
jgi:flagellar biosynthetic protein FliR